MGQTFKHLRVFGDHTYSNHHNLSQSFIITDTYESSHSMVELCAYDLQGIDDYLMLTKRLPEKIEPAEYLQF